MAHPEQCLAELREHLGIHDTAITTLSSALSNGPEVAGMRDHYKQLLRARARTRSAILQLADALAAERARRLRQACALPEPMRVRCRLVATRSSSNKRSSCRARHIARVARAAVKATGDPEADAEPPGLTTRRGGAS